MWTSPVELWRHISFSRWRPSRRKSTSVFRFMSLINEGIDIYSLTIFWWDISIYYGWDITTSGFWIQMTDMLEFYFLFQLWPIYRHMRIILYIGEPSFIAIRQSAAELLRHIDFSWRQPSTMLDLSVVMLEHSRSVIIGLSYVLSFRLDPISEILRFLDCSVLAWNCLFTFIFEAGLAVGAYSPKWRHSPLSLETGNIFEASNEPIWIFKKCLACIHSST